MSIQKIFQEFRIFSGDFLFVLVAVQDRLYAFLRLFFGGENKDPDLDFLGHDALTLSLQEWFRSRLFPMAEEP
jgi:hypothetical protein